MPDTIFKTFNPAADTSCHTLKTELSKHIKLEMCEWGENSSDEMQGSLTTFCTAKLNGGAAQHAQHWENQTALKLGMICYRANINVISSVSICLPQWQKSSLVQQASDQNLRELQ